MNTISIINVQIVKGVSSVSISHVSCAVFGSGFILKLSPRDSGQESTATFKSHLVISIVRTFGH